MSTRTILITGASDGIGAAAARLLAPSGNRLLLVGRSPEKTRAVAAETGGEPFIADFAEFAQVRRLAGEIQDAVGAGGIDVLANNAGGIFGDRTPTVDGNEKTFQVGHLSPFLLTNLLLPQLLTGDGHIINTSSVAARLFSRLDLEDLDNSRRFSAQKAYGDTKLANILFTRSLHETFHDQGISSVAFHPGVVATSFASDTTHPMKWLYHSVLSRFMTSAEYAGGTLAWFIDGVPGSTWTSGGFYLQRKQATAGTKQAKDADLAEGLWRRSAQLVGLAED